MNVLNNFRNSDITYNLNFKFLEKILKKLRLNISVINTNQKISYKSWYTRKS